MNFSLGGGDTLENRDGFLLHPIGKRTALDEIFYLFKIAAMLMFMIVFFVFVTMIVVVMFVFVLVIMMFVRMRVRVCCGLMMRV